MRCDASSYNYMEPRPMMPTDAQERKSIPVYRGFIKYFPDAIVEVTKLSVKGSQATSWQQSLVG